MVVLCSAVTITGGTPPYFVSGVLNLTSRYVLTLKLALPVLPGGQPSATPLEILPTVDAVGAFQWSQVRVGL